MQTNKLIPITIDLVRELKQQGKTLEAENLIILQQLSVKKAKQEVLNDFSRQLRLVKKSKGLCTWVYCKRKAKTYYCDVHRKMANELMRIMRKKRYKNGLCHSCSNKRLRGYTRCENCKRKERMNYNSFKEK